MTDPFVVNRTAERRASDGQHRWAETWTVVRTVLIVCTVLAGLALLYKLRTIILLIVLSLLFAYLIAPLVACIRRRVTFGRSRELSMGVAILIAYLVLLAVIGLAGAWVGPRVVQQMSQSARQAPERLEAAQESQQPFSAIYGRLERFGLSPALVERGLSLAAASIETAASRVAAALVRAAGYLPWLVLIPIIAFFLLRDAAAFKRGAIGLVPAGRARMDAEALVDRIDAALAAVIRAQLLACVIVGIMVGIGFTLIRVPYAALLGVGSAFAEFVPLVGPFVIALVAAGVAALRAPMLALWVLLFLGVLRILEDYVIYPRLVGSNVHLRPLPVILAVLAGAELGGATGVLLSVPALAIGSVTYRYFAESRGGHAETPLARREEPAPPVLS